jgi:glycosyltransferase involved in cell wall biosynthesis
MQHGCACVVSSSGGSAEVARPDQEALVFHSGDPLSLAHSLERLLLNAGLRKELGRAAALRASESLTLKRCTDEYEKLYESVAACERDGGRIS